MEERKQNPRLEFEWLTDECECDTCGYGYAEGANVTLNGEVILSLKPVASCYGGDDYSPQEVFVRVLEKLGYDVDFAPFSDSEEDWDMNTD